MARFTRSPGVTGRRLAAVAALLAGAVAPGAGAESTRPSSAHPGSAPSGNPAMTNAPRGSTIPTLRRVDSSLDARDPLANSLRNPQVDLASPLDFRDLYEVEGRDDVYVRRSGAVYAVFPRSYYVKQQVKQGQAPKEVSKVPGGTTYSIGFPSSLKVVPERRGPASCSERIDCAVDSGVEDLACPARLEQRLALAAGRSSAPPETPATSPAPAEPLPRFVVNESYRRARIGALMHGVADGPPIVDAPSVGP